MATGALRTRRIRLTTIRNYKKLIPFMPCLAKVTENDSQGRRHDVRLHHRPAVLNDYSGKRIRCGEILGIVTICLSEPTRGGSQIEANYLLLEINIRVQLSPASNPPLVR